MLDGRKAVDHDEACAMEVEKRLELGCFEEEVIVYATCYAVDDKAYYYMSDSSENVYRFAESKLKESIYCLPTIRTSITRLIPSGKRADLAKKAKINTAIQMKENLSPEIMKTINQLSPKHNSSAVLLLDQLKANIGGNFNDEALQVFSGFVDFAYYAGKITNFDFLKYQDWITASYTPGEAEEIVHDTHERVYNGFAYVDKYGNIKYYHNAMKALALQRQNELRSEKLLVTPIFEKRYCFNNVDEFPKVIEHFKKLLRAVFDKRYFTLLKHIYDDMPLAADKVAFEATYARAEKEGNSEFINTLNYYGIMWHVWDIKKG